MHHANPHQILAASSLADERTRVLKHGDTFAVFDHFGDIKPGGLGEEGLYHDGTRFLSRLLLQLDGGRPFFLDSTIRDDNDQLKVDLTNPDLCHDDRGRTPMGTLHLTLRRFLWRAACYQELRVCNHGRTRVDATLSIHFAADYADIFEVRGMSRDARGQDLRPEVTAEVVTLAYRGLDHEERRTVLTFAPPPRHLTDTDAHLDVSLAPGEATVFSLTVECRRGERSAALPPIDFAAAQGRAAAEWEQVRVQSCHLRSSNELFNAWIQRAVSDLHMLTTELPTGPYPYAGVPWFNTPFGRDGIITALECLWVQPELARGVLAYLASTQAITAIPEQDAEPGKILHETRNGEMAILKEMPFGRYYGSVDATPLFVLLAGAYYERTGDRDFIASIWPNLDAALRWLEQDGDRDSDGFIEYQRHASDGLLHQGWKDSDEAIFHADGRAVTGAIALCEVQGYAYAAWRAGAALAAMLGRFAHSTALTNRASRLRERFHHAFWCEDLGTYALALDGGKRPCRVCTSNAGQCLFTGIASTVHAARVGRTLLEPAFFCGWGVRTLAAGEPRFNPMSYHNGSVWPHDNALIALGLARYGMGEAAERILVGLFEAGLGFDLHRMPELFCGFTRGSGDGPIPYPVACAPQAWAAASVFLLLQACLGLEVSATEKRIAFTRPRLPACVPELRIDSLSVGAATVDLALVRHGDDVGVNVVRRTGDIDILVAR